MRNFLWQDEKKNDILIIHNFLIKVSELAGLTAGADPGGHPPNIGKIWFFWRTIVIFHTKYLNNFRASLLSAQSFLSASPPPTWYPGPAPGLH
jgi:hypothetical protein